MGSASLLSGARRMLGRALTVATLLVLAGMTASAAPMTSDALARLHDQGGKLVRPFQFAVVGETRAALPYISAPTFRQIITQTNLRRPAFTALLGDMILGDDIAAAPREWDEFARTVSGFAAPVVCAVGEHDVWSDASARLWSERLGPRWYSFDYGASHFIVLDTEAHARHWIAGAQLAWLQKDLEVAKDCKSIFVFMHRPLFADRTSNWDAVHSALMGYPVKAVFASHFGRYEMMPTRQDIQYYITGGGGAEMNDPPEVGGFHHFLLVSVEGARVKIEVLRPNGDQLEPTVVRSTQREATLAARRNVALTAFPAPLGKALSADGAVVVTNTTPLATSGTIGWTLPKSGWTVAPRSDTYEAAPGRQARREFHVTATPDALLGPAPRVDVGYSLTYLAESLYMSHTLPLLRRMDIAPVTTPIVLDGNLTEWNAFAPLPIGNIMGTKPQSADACSATLRLAWARGKLYLAVEVKDDVATFLPVGAESLTDTDNVRLLFAPLDIGQGERDPSTLEYVGCQAADGPRIYRLRAPHSSSGPIPATDVQLATSRKAGVTRYEFGVDAAALAPLSLLAGERFSLNVFVSDDDGPRLPEAFTMLSFIGGGLPNGNAWPRVVVRLSED